MTATDDVPAVLAGLFEGELIESDEPDENLAAHEIVRDLGRYGILGLAYDDDPGRNPGYLFRGEASHEIPLQCSLERECRHSKKLTADGLKQQEKQLLKSFLESDGPGRARRIDPDFEMKPRNEIWWWLSLRQHYENGTRLIDFTRDIRMALFFAIEQHEARGGQLDLVVYCLPCRDLSHPNDKESNKCPFVPNPEVPAVDMNLALGVHIGVEWMDLHKASWYSNRTPLHWSKNGSQRWGWDRPFYENPRIRFQRGMFVYPWDYPSSSLSEQSWLTLNLRESAGPRGIFNFQDADKTLPAKRLRIPAERAKCLKRHLRERFQLSARTVYLDPGRDE